MTEKLILKSINELLGEHFYIPYYQRGYRWTSQQVNDLLNDIWTFATNPKGVENEFYCLQPIVVKHKQWVEAGQELMGWEVVDGQQRLTTMFIIISYLTKEFLKVESLVEDYGKETYSLRYETRPKSEVFLNNITDDKNNIDFYHINAAYNSIKEWFSNGLNVVDRTDKNKFLDTLLGKKEDERSVQIIWYLAESHVNSVELFTRLNLGKIPLTNAELIKALFLSSSSFANQSHDDAIRMKMEISHIWDEIEQKLSDEHFWSFVTNQDQTIFSTKIELLFDMIADKKQEEKDPLYTFLYFLKEFKDNTKPLWHLWLSIEQYYLTLCEWYKDKNLHHKVGFLIATGDNVSNLLSSSKNLKKTELESEFNKAIKQKLHFSTKDIDFSELNYEKHKQLISWILLLFNIESIRTNKNVTEFYSFTSHKKSFWSLEHIHAQNSESLDKTKKEPWFKWLNYHQALIEELIADEKNTANLDELKSLLNDILLSNNDKLTWEKFSSLSKAIIDAFSEKSDDHTDGLHMISNLALLSQPDNSALNNAVFEVKRREIIKMDKEGSYIPLCTRRVFLKYYNDKPSTQQYYFWAKEDRDNYLKEMKKMLEIYLPAEGKNLN